MFDYRDHPLWFRKQSEVTSVRYYSEFGMRNVFEGLNSVFKADKIVISEDDENRHFN